MAFFLSKNKIKSLIHTRIRLFEHNLLFLRFLEWPCLGTILHLAFQTLKIVKLVLKEEITSPLLFLKCIQHLSISTVDSFVSIVRTDASWDFFKLVENWKPNRSKIQKYNFKIYYNVIYFFLSFGLACYITPAFWFIDQLCVETQQYYVMRMK